MTQRAILWDLDGTLIDSESVHAAAFHDAVSELGLVVPEGLHSSLLGASEDKVYEALVATTGLDMSLLAWRACKWEHYKRHAASIRKRDSVADLVPFWAGRGLPMAIVSNSTADEVRICLASTGLGQHMAATVSRADVVCGTPDPESYLLAAERLNVAPRCCLIVEDSPVGAAAGIAAGMTVLFHPQRALAAATDSPSGARYVPPNLNIAGLLEELLSNGATHERRSATGAR